jgi:hypothetical protein
MQCCMFVAVSLCMSHSPASETHPCLAPCCVPAHAGREQPWHWAYYSCNGFTPDVDRGEATDKWQGITPLW